MDEILPDFPVPPIELNGINKTRTCKMNVTVGIESLKVIVIMGHKAGTFNAL